MTVEELQARDNGSVSDMGGAIQKHFYQKLSDQFGLENFSFTAFSTRLSQPQRIALFLLGGLGITGLVTILDHREEKAESQADDPSSDIGNAYFQSSHLLDLQRVGVDGSLITTDIYIRDYQHSHIQENIVKCPVLTVNNERFPSYVSPQVLPAVFSGNQVVDVGNDFTFAYGQRDDSGRIKEITHVGICAIPQIEGAKLIFNQEVDGQLFAVYVDEHDSSHELKRVPLIIDLYELSEQIGQKIIDLHLDLETGEMVLVPADQKVELIRKGWWEFDQSTDHEQNIPVVSVNLNSSGELDTTGNFMVYMTNAPTKISDLAIRLSLSEEELYKLNPWLENKNSQMWISGIDNIISGLLCLKIPEKTIDSEVTGFNVGSTGMTRDGIEGIFKDIDPESGEIIIEQKDGTALTIPQTEFIFCKIFKKNPITDLTYGSGFEHWVKSGMERSVIRVFGYNALETNLIIEKILQADQAVKKELEVSLWDLYGSIVITRQDFENGQAGGFYGYSCQVEGCANSCQARIGLGGGSVEAFHEAVHAANFVLSKDGKTIPVFSGILSEAVSVYVDSQERSQILDPNENNQINADTSLRGQKVSLNPDNHSFNLIGKFQRAAGWAFDDMKKKATQLGKENFLFDLLAKSRNVAEEEGHSINIEDFIKIAEGIWPEHGPNLINEYSSLFIIFE